MPPDVSFNLQICPFTTGPHTTWILVLTISSLQCLNCFIFILWASILSLLNPSIAIQFKILVHFSLFLKLCLDHLQNDSASELDYSSGFISTPLLSKSHIYFLNGLDYLAIYFTNFFISGILLLPLIIQSTHSFIYSFINSSRYLFKKISINVKECWALLRHWKFKGVNLSTYPWHSSYWV